MTFDAKPKSQLDINSLTDIELFDLMKGLDTNPEASKMAWTEFYKRYSKFLWKCSLKLCKSLPDGKEVAKDLFQNSIQKIYDKSKTFNGEKAVSIKAWIGRIIYNEFIDYYRKYHLRFKRYNQDEPIEETIILSDDQDHEDGEIIEAVTNFRLEQISQLLSQLNPKEFKILMVTMTFFQIDNPKAHLPDKEIKELCEEFNIKPDAIRQIKRRALLKLQTFAKEMITTNSNQHLDERK